MNYLYITEEEALYIAQQQNPDNGFVNIADSDEDHRWYIAQEVIFKRDDKFYQFRYMKPATELQEDQDRVILNENGLVECSEVTPYEVTITKYKVKN